VDVEYKGGRDKERSARVYSFEEKTTELLESLGIRNMYPGVLEADDVIWWLSEKIRGEKIIVSVDQDMLQLIDKKTTVYSPIKDVIINYSNFEDTVGVPLDQFLRYKSLMGDKSDNLPGIPRCGSKTAQKLVSECTTDTELINRLGKDTLKPYFHNLEMIDLRKGHVHHPDDAKMYEDQYNALMSHRPDLVKFKNIASVLNMKKVIDDYPKWSELFNGEQLTKTLEDIVNNLGLSK
jgi:5'-3' exonuclease